jgi:hypothetical protein
VGTCVSTCLHTYLPVLLGRCYGEVNQQFFFLIGEISPNFEIKKSVSSGETENQKLENEVK